MTASPEVLLSRQGRVSVITLNRPACLNAINESMVQAFIAALRDANADVATAAIVLHGNGKAFCAGDDLTAHDVPADGDEMAMRARVDVMQQVSREIMFGEKPVIAAVHGWAVGGGFEWTINCDAVIWSEEARAFFPEIEWGMFVSGGVTALLPRLIGPQRTFKWIMGGEHLDGAALQAAGLVTDIVPTGQHLEAAVALAELIASRPTKAVRNLKRAINLLERDRIEAAMAEETKSLAASLLDAEVAERVAGFKARGSEGL
ncbi:enoyl-CoA hydratase [Sphingosinicella microcystinivorans]|uniref:Enoyl-CoA hydratase n=1 Tax=Sphingosinicella microcystinivorans TaxID=335406 RepID=A0AAD1D6W3_SPHMI|nr:enoyl-CoA hydratase/isomerase family protein [Sphingosinicella microcystinivorans]RKS91508.1 enoyl-CoA hydratase/carnithine racemase [Sphingosinicella microcystinivorans]BBE34487.1 enoyl-CoA hydratase [Sphingosinicella microcystinivorans]